MDRAPQLLGYGDLVVTKKLIGILAGPHQVDERCERLVRLLDGLVGWLNFGHMLEHQAVVLRRIQCERSVLIGGCAQSGVGGRTAGGIDSVAKFVEALHVEGFE